MAFGALIIGDEILSGRRQDRHLAKLIELLAARGLRLAWARYAGDEPTRLTAALRDSFATGDHVFSFGGIGATPDDHTRQCAAEALGRELALHPDAEHEIRAQFGAETTEHRLRMGVFPRGSDIIPNPYNRIPGFSVDRHHFVPGFPVMAWPMVEWVLDHRLADLHNRDDYIESAIVVWEAMEGRLVDLMERISEEHPALTLFSLPTFAEGEQRRSLELGLKGASAEVTQATDELRAEISRRGYEWQDKP